MDRYREIKEKLLNIARQDPDVLAVIAFGSSVRTNTPADEFSDLDLLLVCENPEAWLYGDRPAKLGEIKISFTEPSFAGAMERRMLYGGALDLDLIVLTKQQLELAAESGVLSEVLSRGYRVLYDNAGIGDRLEKLPEPQHREMTQQEFTNTVNDFWFHTVWAARKILRGELWTAQMCVDAYLKSLLLKMLEAARAGREDVWHDGRFLENWAGEDVVAALGNCFAHYERENTVSALKYTADLFGELSCQVARERGFSHPRSEEDYARSLLNTNLGENG